MSIFVLNLATLLGPRPRRRLLAADDQPVPRGAGAPRPDGPDRGRRGRPGHGRDRRPGRLLQRPDRAARPARPRPVRVHDPALGRDRRRDRRRPRGRRGADPAAGRPDDRSGRGSTAARSGGSRPRPATDGPWARLARRVMRHPGRRARPDPRASCSLLGSPFLHVRFNAPDASILPPTCRRARRSTGCAREFGEGEFAPIVLADPDRRRRRRPRRTWPRCTTTRGASRPTRGSRRVDSLVDVDPRLTLEQYQLLYGDPNGPPRPVRRRPPWRATTRGDLTAFTITTPYGPNRDEGRALVADLRDPGGAARAAGRGRPSWSAAARRTWPTSSTASRADFPRTALFIIVTTYLVLFVLLRSVVLPAKALVMNTLSIVGQLRGAGLDLPGRQPVGARSGSSRSGSSRRPSR